MAARICARDGQPGALIQVASEEVCLIFYMLKIGSMPPALEELLLDKHFLKVSKSPFDYISSPFSISHLIDPCSST